jgi:hypothetical protein
MNIYNIAFYNPVTHEVVYLGINASCAIDAYEQGKNFAIEQGLTIPATTNNVVILTTVRGGVLYRYLVGK